MIVFSHCVYFLMSFPQSKVLMLSISNICIIDHWKEECVKLIINVVHFKSNVIIIIILLQSNVVVSTIWTFNKDKLIRIFFLDSMGVLQIWIFLVNHSCFDMSWTWYYMSVSSICIVWFVWVLWVTFFLFLFFQQLFLSISIKWSTFSKTKMSGFFFNLDNLMW